jgi:hypothetical protein
MNNQEDELGRRLAKLLDSGAADIGPAQRERLTAARQAALARHRSLAAPAWAPAWTGNFSVFTERRLFGVRYLLPVAALVLGLAGVLYVHSSGTTGDIADIDAGLLTDDLPINAYLDKGFDSWLKRSSR